MKILIAVGVIGLIGGGILFTNNEVSYNSSDNEVVTETVEVTPAEYVDILNDEDAIKAAEDVLRKKKLQAELEQLSVEEEALKARMEEIEKELGTFWKDPKNVKALIRSTFPEEPAKAIAIAMCESGLKPKAYNPTNSNGSTDGGLWQINSVHDSRLKQLGLDKYDPEDATKFARMLYDERGGFQDWVCYTKGMHVAYL